MILRGRDGASLNWCSNGKGPIIVLIHGVGADLQSWEEIVQQLSNEYQLVRLDLRGHGRSDRISSCSMEDFVQDIELLFRAAGIKQAHLVGFSLGGLIAQHFALAYPERLKSIVLLSTVADRTPEERVRILGRADIIKTDGISAVTKQAEERWFSPSFRAAHPERIARRLSELCDNDPISYEAAYRVFATADEGLRYCDISVPTLIATGEHDPNSNSRMARALHAGISGSRLRILPNLRHSVLVEAPQLIASLIRDFVAEQELSHSAV
jgi:pimeloyl-ACP methyl ester carboxylesterase